MKKNLKKKEFTTINTGIFKSGNIQQERVALQSRKIQLLERNGFTLAKANEKKSDFFMKKKSKNNLEYSNFKNNQKYLNKSSKFFNLIEFSSTKKVKSQFPDSETYSFEYDSGKLSTTRVKIFFFFILLNLTLKRI